VNDAPASTLRLAGELTVRDGAALHQQLGQACGAAGDVVLDLGGATEVDVCLLQLLVAAKASLAAGGRRLVLAPPPAGPVLEAMQRAGMPEDSFEVHHG
jgi:anti-anti-sigma regulatory factor